MVNDVPDPGVGRHGGRKADGTDGQKRDLTHFLGRKTGVEPLACCRVDTAFALMAIPTLTGALLLSPRVLEAMREYFAEDRR